MLHDETCFREKTRPLVPETPRAHSPGWREHVTLSEGVWEPGEMLGEYETLGEEVPSAEHCDHLAPRGRRSFCALGYSAELKVCRVYTTCEGLAGYAARLDGRSVLQTISQGQ